VNYAKYISAIWLCCSQWIGKAPDAQRLKNTTCNLPILFIFAGCLVSLSLQRKAMARATALCILAAALCLLRSIAFVPAPATRTVDPAVVTGAAVLATVPAGADAFVFKGAVADVGDWEVEVNR